MSLNFSTAIKKKIFSLPISSAKKETSESRLGDRILGAASEYNIHPPRLVVLRPTV